MKYVVLVLALTVLLAACSRFPAASEGQQTQAVTPPAVEPQQAGGLEPSTIPTPTPTTTTPTPQTQKPTTTPSAAEGISAAELATHNTRQDCWVAYQGARRDRAAWLPRHPGGVSAISRYCGTSDEFASAFSKQHGTRQVSRLKKEGSYKGTFAA